MGNATGKDINSSFLVTGIKDHSPGVAAGLVVDNDFILSVEGNYLRQMTKDGIKEFIESHEDIPIKLVIYSKSLRNLREVVITPSRNWPGEGLLGVSVTLRRFDYSNKNEDVSFTDIYALDEYNRESIDGSEFKDVNITGTPQVVKDFYAKGDSSTGSSKKTQRFGLLRSKTTNGINLRSLGSSSSGKAVSCRNIDTNRETFSGFAEYGEDSPLKLTPKSDTKQYRRSLSFSTPSPMKLANDKLFKEEIAATSIDEDGSYKPETQSGKAKKTKLYRMRRTFLRSIGQLPSKDKSSKLKSQSSKAVDESNLAGPKSLESNTDITIKSVSRKGKESSSVQTDTMASPSSDAPSVGLNHDEDELVC